MSPLAQGRGLKHFCRILIYELMLSPLAQGRGLKHFHYTPSTPAISASPLAQGRGLKLVGHVTIHISHMSPLAQGRGLKHLSLLIACQRSYVAPRAGAWIETMLISVQYPD